MKTAVFTAFLFLFLTQLTAQIIPQSRRVDWTYAGLQRPRPVYANAVDITTFGGVGNGIIPNDIALQLAILSLAGDSGIINFPAGTYSFIHPVTLRSGIVLHGQGSDSTSLQFNLSGDSNCITIMGANTATIADVTSPAYKGEQSIVVNNPSFFSVGDYGRLFQNDSALVYDIYNTVGQIIYITNISGDTISFSSPLRRSYSLSDAPRLRKLVMAEGAGLECLKVKRLDATANLTANIFFTYAAHCWVKGVESDSCNFAHISMNSCTNIEISGCYFHGAFAYGSGGQGYGVAFNRTTGECLVENSIFRHLRHAMLVQSGSNGNVCALNYAREGFRSESAPNDLAGDIVLHGNYPYANLFEGNMVNNIVVDASHGINGPFNTFFRNRAELWGILFSNNSGDSTNVVGNEVTSSSGYYLLKGYGNFERGNYVQGLITPNGTDSLPDHSYYYGGDPYYWLFAAVFPSIGPPNTYNTGTIPARAGYNAGVFTVCPTNNVLASHNLLFTAEKKVSANLLRWQVDNSRETAYFEAQRSSNRRSFEKLQTVVAKEGTRSYACNDMSPNKGINYYRIVQVQKTGGRVYSSTVAINNGNTAIARVYPNPAKDRLTIYADDLVGNVHVIIRSSIGQLLKENMVKASSSNAISIDVSALKHGVYFIGVYDSTTGRRMMSKFVKE